MTRIKFVLKEFFRNLGRHPGTALVSFLSLTLLYLLFDLFWVASLTSDQFYRSLVSELQMEIFLPEELSDSSAVSLEKSILGLPEVASVESVSKEAARQELESLVGVDLLIGYDSTNPLPRSFRIRIQPEYLSTRKLDILAKRLSGLTSGGEVRYSRSWLAGVERTRALIFRVGFALGLLILIATLLSSANNIRLMARARAVGFRQMMLLGAPALFAVFPFLIEGFILAGLSAAAGWGMVYYAVPRVSFARFSIVLPMQDDIILFCVVVALLGGMSGYVGIRKLLR